MTVKTSMFLAVLAGTGLASASLPAASQDTVIVTPDDPMIVEIDATVNDIDRVLNGYIVEYLESVGLKASELSSIESRLKRVARQERPSDSTSLRGVPDEFFLVQAKLRFLASAHEAFAGGAYPADVRVLLEKLSGLEETLRSQTTD